MVQHKPRFGGGTNMDCEKNNRDNTAFIKADMAGSLPVQDNSAKMEGQKEQDGPLWGGEAIGVCKARRDCQYNNVNATHQLEIGEASEGETEMVWKAPESEIKDGRECDTNELNASRKDTISTECDKIICQRKEKQHDNASCCPHPFTAGVAYHPNPEPSLSVDGFDFEETEASISDQNVDISEVTKLFGETRITDCKRQHEASNNNNVIASYSDSEKPRDSITETVDDSADDVAGTKQVECLSRTIELMGIFRSLGIGVRAKVYSKLYFEKIQHWESYFKHNIKDELLSHLFEFDQHAVTNPMDEYDRTEVGGDVVYCKNLFLKDRKGQFYLLVAEESCTVDLKQLKGQLNAARNLSFANDEAMGRILKLRPGEVTPFAIMNESARDVRVVFHESLTNARVSGFPLAFHPFSPVLQVEITFHELSLFVSHHGKQIEILESAKSDAHQQQHQQREFKTETTFSKQKENGRTKGTKQLTVSPDPIPQFDASEMTGPNVENNAPYPCEKDIHTEDKEKELCDDKEDSAVEFLAEPEASGENQNKQQRRDKIKCKDYDRKGKLKSYIRKNEKRMANRLTNRENGESLGSEVSTSKEDTMREESFKTSHNSVQNTFDTTPANLDKISPKATLPEIEKFYTLLLQYNIRYKEINTGEANSSDIGPALGVKCFLLKDKRLNYFLVISHEFYEPDYGRLKKSLRPKKKLEICEAEEYMDMLGVDREQFTPFAIINERAKRKNITVFFTEKIMQSNIVVCIQHPYGKGIRILMESSELQQFLANFTPNDIGAVEEKVWAEKYNRAFSQFDAASRYYRVSQHFHQKGDFPHIDETEKLKFAENRTASTGDTSGTRIKGMEKSTRDNSFYNNSLPSTLVQYCVSFSNNVMRYLGCYFSKHDIADCAADNGSSVDTTESIIKRESGRHEKKEHSKGADTTTDKETLPVLTEFDDETTRNEDIIISFEDNRPHYENAFWETRAVSTNAIRRHLDETEVEYVWREKNAGDDDEVKDFDDDDVESDNGNDSDDRMSQICTALHLTNEAESTHYIIIGRKSEHVSIKRFRRRFQISNRLFFVIDENHTVDSGEKTTLPFTNPFSVILSSEHEQEQVVVCKVGRGVKYKVVLYTSVYMDPEMECVFELGKMGTRLSMSSEELENYCKRIGMEVWYMP